MNADDADREIRFLIRVLYLGAFLFRRPSIGVVKIGLAGDPSAQRLFDSL